MFEYFVTDGTYVVIQSFPFYCPNKYRHAIHKSSWWFMMRLRQPGLAHTTGHDDGTIQCWILGNISLMGFYFNVKPIIIAGWLTTPCPITYFITVAIESMMLRFNAIHTHTNICHAVDCGMRGVQDTRVESGLILWNYEQSNEKPRQFEQPLHIIIAVFKCNMFTLIDGNCSNDLLPPKILLFSMVR